MDLQTLVCNLKADGWTDHAVRFAILDYLQSLGYQPTPVTVLVIDAKLKNYNAESL